MELLHKPENKAFISELINVQTFLDTWAQNDPYRHYNARGANPDKAKRDFLDKMMEGVDSNLMANLRNECSGSLLDCEGESKEYAYSINKSRNPWNFGSLPDVDLATVRLKRQELTRYMTDYKYRDSMQNLAKMVQPVPIPERIKNRGKAIPVGRVVAGPEVVLRVHIYMPYKRDQQQVVKFIKQSQEYLVLGCQKLTELRDEIKCVLDHQKSGDFSANPSAADDVPSSKDKYRSNFLYINDTFYNDMRYDECVDTSEVLIDWSQNPQRKMGPFFKANMEDTRFRDLTLRLGYPYLYQHQGNCEHLIVFSDLRLLGNGDSRDLDDYPLVTQVYRSARIFCMICYKFTAKWMTQGDDSLPYDPFLYCDKCLRLLKYDKHGNKIGPFTLHTFVDRTALC